MKPSEKLELVLGVMEADEAIVPAPVIVGISISHEGGRPWPVVRLVSLPDEAVKNGDAGYARLARAVENLLRAERGLRKALAIARAQRNKFMNPVRTVAQREAADEDILDAIRSELG